MQLRSPRKDETPGDQVWWDPAFPQDSGQCVVIEVIKASLDVQEQRGHLEVWPLLGFDVIREGEVGVVGGKPRERTALVWVQLPFQPGCCKQAGCYDSF